MRRGPKVHMGKRYEVSAWFPAKKLVDAAEERTEGLVGYFLANARNDLWRQKDLHTLARSCYLQGAQDTAMVAAEMRLKEIKAHAIHQSKR